MYRNMNVLFKENSGIYVSEISGKHAVSSTVWTIKKYTRLLSVSYYWQFASVVLFIG